MLMLCIAAKSVGASKVWYCLEAHVSNSRCQIWIMCTGDRTYETSAET
jgi:hypothetical protein